MRVSSPGRHLSLSIPKYARKSNTLVLFFVYCQTWKNRQDSCKCYPEWITVQSPLLNFREKYNLWLYDNHHKSRSVTTMYAHEAVDVQAHFSKRKREVAKNSVFLDGTLLFFDWKYMSMDWSWGQESQNITPKTMIFLDYVRCVLRIYLEVPSPHHGISPIYIIFANNIFWTLPMLNNYQRLVLISIINKEQNL